MYFVSVYVCEHRKKNNTAIHNKIKFTRFGRWFFFCVCLPEKILWKLIENYDLTAGKIPLKVTVICCAWNSIKKKTFFVKECNNKISKDYEKGLLFWITIADQPLRPSSGLTQNRFTDIWVWYQNRNCYTRFLSPGLHMTKLIMHRLNCFFNGTFNPTRRYLNKTPSINSLGNFEYFKKLSIKMKVSELCGIQFS